MNQIKKIMHDTKRRAVALQKELQGAKTYMQCLHIASQEAGYKSWGHIIAEKKVTKALEQ